MDIASLVEITAAFKQFAGEALADLKRRQEADIDWELLRLKRSVLEEHFADAKTKLVQMVSLEKANKVADLSSRGLGNSTIVDSFTLAIEKQAAEELDRMGREYNRAIEEIAYLDRKVSLRRGGWWQRLKQLFKVSA